MPGVLFLDEFFDVERRALAGVERANALVEFCPQPAQLFDVRQELPADLFLIGFGQPSYLGNRLFKRLCHDGIIPDRYADAPLAAATRTRRAR